MTPQVPTTFQGSPVSTDGEPWLGYIRVSTWREEKISPEIQRTAIEEWARRTRRRIVGWIEDLDVSGRTFKRKIMGGIERVERREVRGIAVWRYSRFGRDRVGNAVNLARLESVGGRLESATEPVDAGTAIGRFQRGMIMEFSAFESDRTGEQWKEVHAHRLGLLLPSGGRPRFGYIWHPRRVPDAEAVGGYRMQEEWYEPDAPSGAAAALADLYMQYAEVGTGFKRLALQLHDGGFTTTRGRRWSDVTLLRYMDSGFAAGLLQVRDACGCPKNEKSSCRHWRRFPGAHEALISDETWKAYLERRKSIARTAPRQRSAVYEGSGLNKCSLCRGAMTGKANVNGEVYWRCARADSSGACPGVTGTETDLRGEVRKFLAKVADGIDAAPPVPATVPGQRTAPDTEKERARLSAEHSSFQAALARLIKDYALNPDRYPDDAYDTARRDLEKDRDATLKALAALGEPDDKKGPAARDFQPLAEGILEEWDSFVPSHRNVILRRLVRRIEILPRPSRHETAAKVHPVWEPDPWEHSVHSEAMVDGIAWSAAG
ncbi:recombinase family protein [Streptomyces rubiginosohelvolus]